MAGRLRMTGAYKVKVGLVAGLLLLILLVVVLHARGGGGGAPGQPAAPAQQSAPSPEELRKKQEEERRMESLRAVLRKSMAKFIEKDTGALLIPKEPVLKTLDLNELEEMYMRADPDQTAPLEEPLTWVYSICKDIEKRVFGVKSRNNTDILMSLDPDETPGNPLLLVWVHMHVVCNGVYRYIENTQVNCARMLHVGWEYDGGYHMCETTVPKPPCLMYSFGIRKDFVFEDGVSSEYGCEVHAFDPYDGVDDFQQADKVYFHNLGIGGKNERITIFKNTPQEQTGTVKTLGSIKTLLKHQNRTIDILKMDTEGAEWFSLDEQLKTGTLKGVTILIVEFHVWVGDANAFEHATHPVRSVDGYLRYLNDLRGLYEQGFRIYFFRMWTWCSFKDEIKNRRTACHEVHFMREN